MPNRKTLSRLALAGIVAALVAAPTASAMPINPLGSDAAVQDARGESAASGGGTASQDTTAALQDVRGEAAAASGGGTASQSTTAAVQDARGESAAGGGTGSSVPSWPAYPTPLPRPPQQPIATDGGDDIGGVDLPVALLILAGTLGVSGIAVVAMKGRAPARTAH